MCVSWGGANKGDQKTTISSGLSHLLNQVSYKGTCTFKEQTLFFGGVGKLDRCIKLSSGLT